MAQVKSFVENSGPSGTVRLPCFTCAHCSQVVVLRSTDTERGFCLKCMHHTCVRCGGSDRCTPFEKKIEEHEKAYRARQRLLGALG